MNFYNDADFIRNINDSKIVPLTKKEIRILTLGLMGVSPEDLFLDLGAGTGGITCEAAKLAYKSEVIAVDRDEKAYNIIKANVNRFHLGNIKVIKEDSIKFLREYNGPKFNKIFIGGSGGNLKNTILSSKEVLLNDGTIAANFITLENCYTALKEFKLNFKNTNLICANISNSVDLKGTTILQSLNPVFILVAKGVN